jgi:hypothetical protein
MSCSDVPPPAAPTAEPADVASGLTATLSRRRPPRGNQPPVIQFGTPRPPDPAPSNTRYTVAGGQPEDPDGDENPNVLCTRTTLTVSGPCRAGIGGCGGVGDVFDVDLLTATGPGTCEVIARVRDSWGALGTDRLRFQVSAP